MDAIRHRIKTGRLHVVFDGVYAVGRRQLTPEGWWMAAALACGPNALLSHTSAATAWRIATFPLLPIHVSVPQTTIRCLRGIELHRRKALPPEQITSVCAIPASSVPLTLLDLAGRHERNELEAMINAADKHNLSDPEHLRSALDAFCGYPGVRTLRQILDRRTFTLTDSELERLFMPIARAAGLPFTQAVVNGYRVDFYWPDLKLVVETRRPPLPPHGGPASAGQAA